MKRTVFFFIFFGLTVVARENPFFATSGNPSNTVTSEINSYKPPLNSMTHNLPSSARVLKEVTFTYQNADGSTEKSRIEIDKSIVSDMPVIISQSSKNKTSAQK